MPTCPNFIGGEWKAPSNVATSPVYNPSTGEVIAECPVGNAAHVDEAVEAAAAAFPAWRERRRSSARGVFFRYRQLLEAELRSHLREHFARARQDARRGARQSVPRHRECRIRLRHPVAAHGRHAGEHRARRGLRDDAPTARRVRRHHAVQLSRDGAACGCSRSRSPAETRSC